MRRWTWLVTVLLAGCSFSRSLPPVTEVGPASSDLPVTVTVLEPTTTAPIDDRSEERMTMIEEQLEPRGIIDPLVLEAMRTVPRDQFVTEGTKSLAYADSALPIGYGQTISQPYIVGLMTQALDVAPGDKVLEIGTGSGYQAAVLAAMGCEVYSMEIVPELAESAAATLDKLGYDVTLANADGYYGWEEHGPFDGIIVTAAPDHVPQPLLDQLGEGAALIIPIGPIGAIQTMWRFAVVDGEVTSVNLGDVVFVPFTRAEE